MCCTSVSSRKEEGEEEMIEGTLWNVRYQLSGEDEKPWLREHSAKIVLRSCNLTNCFGRLMRMLEEAHPDTTVYISKIQGVRGILLEDSK